MRIGRVLAVVAGSMLALAALVALFGGAVLGIGYVSQRDADGFISTRSERLTTPTFALTSDDVDLGLESGSGWLFKPGRLGTVRVTVRPVDGRPLFVGVAPAAALDRYLADVRHDALVEVELSPFRPTYRTEPGTRRPAPPGRQTFWAEASSSSGSQTVEFDLRKGSWVLVVMRADGSAGVAAEASVGAKAGWVPGLALALVLGGIVALGIALPLIIIGGHGLLDATTPEPLGEGGATAAGAAGAVAGATAGWSHHTSAGTAAWGDAPEPDGVGTYPVRLTGMLETPLSRGLWLVKWLLLIPHAVVLAFLWLAFFVVTLIAFVAILFTGRYPRGLFDFNVGVLRWSWRVTFYGYGALGTDRYPPFTLAPDPTYPASFDVEYPATLSRGRALVKWLLALPHLLLVTLFGGGFVVCVWPWSFFGDDGLDWAGSWFWPTYGAIAVLVVVAGVLLLFGREYPRSLFDLVVGLQRWSFRVIAYVALMRDEYPPFRLDSGPNEPAPTRAAPATPDTTPHTTPDTTTDPGATTP